jgi:hypothetical protein
LAHIRFHLPLIGDIDLDSKPGLLALAIVQILRVARPVAIILSPDAKAAFAISLPKSREAPVTIQTLSGIVVSLFISAFPSVAIYPLRLLATIFCLRD